VSVWGNRWKALGVIKDMEILLALVYIALLIAIIFFGPLQEYLYTKKDEWDHKKNSRERNADETPIPADDEKTGSILSMVLTILAIAFFIWKILTTTFTPL
jgi:hypothetical protein